MQSLRQTLFKYAWNVTGSDRMTAFETLHIEKLALLINIMLGREKQLVLFKCGLPLCSFMLLPHYLFIIMLNPLHIIFSQFP
jgi:hypothetical protein